MVSQPLHACCGPPAPPSASDTRPTPRTLSRWPLQHPTCNRSLGTNIHSTGARQNQLSYQNARKVASLTAGPYSSGHSARASPACCLSCPFRFAAESTCFWTLSAGSAHPPEKFTARHVEQRSSHPAARHNYIPPLIVHRQAHASVNHLLSPPP